MLNFSNVSSIYVSQEHGNDEHMGVYSKVNAQRQGPVKTIETALKRIEDIRRAGGLQPIKIVITDDIYYIDKPVVIGEKTNAVTITGEKEHTKVCGGFKITGFREDTFNGYRCFSAEVPEIKDGVWFTDLYVDGKRADFTSYPKDGTLEPEAVENTSSKLHASSKWFIAKEADIEIFKNLKNFGDCIISYNHYWIDEHTPIEGFDFDTRKITFKYPSRMTIELTHPASALRYKLENVAESFANPNEWYLDREEQKVYYIPRNGEQTAENIEVYAPLTDKLFIIQGKKDEKAKNITLSGLDMFCTKGDYKSIVEGLNPDTGEAILDESGEGYASDVQSVCYAHGSVEFYYAHACSLEHCTMKNIGVHAVTINSGCDNIRIYGNSFSDMGGGGVKINGGAFGCEKCDETFGNVVAQNTITDCGNRYFAACGVLIMHSYENTVANNEISWLYYTGVSVGWVWGYGNSIARDNVIEYNHIHHLGQGKLSDMGGVYLLGKQSGTKVRNNIIHDVTSKHYGGWGVYTDEGSSYITVENNICYNLSNNCYHQHFGMMNTIRNNIFVKAGVTPVKHTRPEIHTGIILENNIIVSDNSPSYMIGWGEEEDGGVQVIAGHNNLHFNMSGDVYIVKIGDKKYNLQEHQTLFGSEDGSIVAAPCFADYENNDFTLADNSPAYSLGFKKIDTKNVGVTI